MSEYVELLARLAKYNQEHLLRFYNELSTDEVGVLLKDIENIDLEELDNIKRDTSLNNIVAHSYKLSPIDVLDKSSLPIERRESYAELGEELIKKQKVAVCTMAGGQGSRLGHDGPKGTFVVPLKIPKSIFQIATETLLRAYKRYGVYINWYIMTSEENDSVTKAYFESNNYFGYNKDYVRFFKQGQLPLTDFDGKILLKEKGRVFKAANGNGGIFKALEDNGIIEELIEKHIEYMITCNVDNILINPIDSIMLGALKSKNTELGIKSITKRDAKEPVGVCCYKDGKPTVVEYIDFPEELAMEKNDDGTLKFSDVHFGCNYISTNLLRKIANEKLPYHGARKKNNYIDENGNLTTANDVNSIKYEMFVFDGFEKAESAIVFRVKREEEFAPIKYKDGEDSPITAANMYENYFNKQ